MWYESNYGTYQVGNSAIMQTTESVRNMQDMMNAGQDDPTGETWLNSDELPSHVTIIDGEEFIARYVF